MSQDRTNAYTQSQYPNLYGLQQPAFVPSQTTQVVALDQVENKLKQLYSLQLTKIQVLANEVFKYLDKMNDNFPSQKENISKMRELIVKNINLSENLEKNTLASLKTAGTELSDYIDNTQKLRTLYIVLGCLSAALAVAGVVTAYTLATTPAVIGGAVALFVGYNLAVKLSQSEPVKADPKDGENYKEAVSSLTEFLSKGNSEEPSMAPPTYTELQNKHYQYNPYT